MKEYSLGERVARFALVEPGICSPPQRGIADPVEGKKRAFEPSNLAKREPVSLTVPDISAAQVDLAEFYQSIAYLRGGDTSAPIDLTPDGLAEARNYFQARAESQLDFLRAPEGSFVHSATMVHSRSVAGQ